MSLNRANENDSWVQNPDGTSGYTCSLITGCDKRCPWCFAWKLANGRLKNRYLSNLNTIEVPGDPEKPYVDPFLLRFWDDRYWELYAKLSRMTRAIGIFLNIMGETFADSVPFFWKEQIMKLIAKYQLHRYYLLTHQPQNLPPWSPFPGSCWVGATVNTNADMTMAMTSLPRVEAEVIFLSFEPLIGSIGMSDHRNMKGIIGWVIIGAMTGTKKDILEMYRRYPGMTPMPWGGRWTLQPKFGWVEEIVRAADNAGIRVFLKENLSPLFKYMTLGLTDCLTYPYGELRHEMPEVKHG